MQRAGSDEVNFEKIIVVPPDGGWGWVVVAAAFFCVLVMDGISNTFGLLIPVFQKEFSVSVSQISLVNSLFTGFYFIFAPLAGSLSNRFGFRAVIIAGSIISSFGISVSIFTNSVSLLFVTYGLIGGLGFSLMYINVILTVGFYFEKWRPLATGIAVSASGVGYFVFAPTLQILLQKYSWRHIFVGYAVLVFLCSIVAICFRPLSPIALGNCTDERNRKPGKKIGSMHNTRYPTAAKALDFNQLKDSLLTLNSSRLSSVESFELLKYNARDSHVGRTSDMKRRMTEYSQLQTLHDLTATSSSQSRLRPISNQIRVNRECSCCKCKWKAIRKCCKKQKRPGVRPLYRDDIFYDGSVSQLPVYDKNSTLIRIPSIQQSTAIKSSLLYHLSVTRLPTHNDLQEERDERCHWFPESMTRALKTMFDFRVFKFPLFTFFCTSTCFLATGVNVPTYFTYVRALAMGLITESDGPLIFLAIGITNTIGRILCGVIASVPKINIFVLHFGFLFFGAVLNVCSVFIRTKATLIIYGALYGLVLAEQGSLRSVILVKLVGLENLTNAFGMLLLFLGIFTVIGAPVAGITQECTGSYDAVFLFSAFFLLLASIALIPIFVGKYKVKYNTGQPTEHEVRSEVA